MSRESGRVEQAPGGIRIRRPLPGWDVEFKSADALTGATPRQVCRQYILSAVLDGHGSRRHRGVCHHAAPGCCALMQPDEVYSGTARDMTYRSLWVSPAVLESLADDVTGEAAPPRFAATVIPDARLAGWLLRLFRTEEQRAAPLLQVETALLEGLTHLLVHHAERRPLGPPRGEERSAVRRARGYLEDNHSEDVALEELAAVSGLSASRLAHVFRRAVGVAPHEYQTQVRVERAKSLLTQGIAVGEVAQRVGFFDQAHLNRHFRRLVQVTPGSYQRHCRAEAARTYKIGPVALR